MKPELIVALDLPSADRVGPVVDSLGPRVTFYKVGLELFAAAGPRVIQDVRQRGKRVFLDLKLHDIPRTVANAVGAAARHGVSLLTVHASGGRAMLKAAAEAAAGFGPEAPRLVAVTVLTSLDEGDLRDAGVNRPVSEQTLALGAMAFESGVRGLVCSVWEAAGFRERFGPDAAIVTPGIRPAGAGVGDQKRVATPEAAVRAGATYLVVGRPILEAPDPAAAAAGILAEMEGVR